MYDFSREPFKIVPSSGHRSRFHQAKLPCTIIIFNSGTSISAVSITKSSGDSILTLLDETKGPLYIHQELGRIIPKRSSDYNEALATSRVPLVAKIESYFQSFADSGGSYFIKTNDHLDLTSDSGDIGQKSGHFITFFIIFSVYIC